MDDQDLGLTLKEEVALTALCEKPRYALEIVKAIEGGGGKKISPNNLYPILKKLEKRGFVSSCWGDEAPGELTGARRRYYKLEGTGYKALQQKAATLKAIAAWEPKLAMQPMSEGCYV
ncbi:helix-turn-helix transcriptional regulator [Leptolyngbya cf. ectocarpi LEGE 11479]|uniref:Helix-turn-helix transcriptional regulator n=1 Tax=Leptolyngbya cf. ectocarpi LEGE 11479 TaxID=1828722 RepID=A0A929FAI8_LEPEC|nr:PadR family transcriptional regulator [Leptolyngbya ectocarpi]MBE9070011.1 helix-turn-helix transcriptional regulator [Leptolyngbya cf. ectocarpi LEGE 11479]